MKMISRGKFRRATIALASTAIAAAALAVPAMASAVTIEGAESGVPIAEGAGITATSGALVFTFSTGLALECTETEFDGTVSSNGGATAKVTVETSRLEGGGAVAGSCPLGIGAPVFVSTNLFPGSTWLLSFHGGGTFSLAGPAAITFTIVTGPETQVNCTFMGGEEEEGGGIGMISGTYTEAPELTEVTMTEAPFTLVHGPAELCGSYMELNGTLQTESEGEGIVVS